MATVPPAPEPPYPGIASGEDWEGVLRDTGVLFGSQVVAVGIIYLMPESVSSWSREQKRDSFKKYHKNVGHLAVDRDKFYINYVLHPYWGAAYYTRARERGLSEGAAVAFSAGVSAMYEFGVEAFFEKPSIQDLVVTPLAGSLLGAYLFEPLRESIRRKEERRWYHDTLMALTDPVGVLSTGVERITGRKSRVRLEYAPAGQLRSSGSREPDGHHMGLTLDFPLD